MGEKRPRTVSHRGNFAAFQTRRALSRLKESRVFRSVRENASGRVACAPRARASTHADERDARTSAPRRFSRDTPRLYFSPTCPPTNRSRPSLPVVAETPRGPRGGSRRRRARPRTPRARSWWPPRRSPPARSRSARRAGCTTPTAPRWGRCTGTRGARVASRARARTVVASETNGFSDTLLLATTRRFEPLFRRTSSGPIVGVGPFGGVAPIGYTSGVSLGGAPRFFPGGFGGVGADFRGEGAYSSRRPSKDGVRGAHSSSHKAWSVPRHRFRSAASMFPRLTFVSVV